ncbi:hypothetical protein AAFP30_16030 [Gordonia sp. CPCC 205515]|uniref:hypothetical protein n=1 Tax=Gordonia sp. CPCC 205515 TaxID=3140791 RepID=UPI003AF38288
MTSAGLAVAGTRRPLDSTLLVHGVVLLLGASSAVQIANFTVTALSIVCLALAPAFLLMTHRGVELLPILLGVLGWISFLASCLVNHVGVLWPNAVAPAAFSLYLIGLSVITRREVDMIATALAGIGIGTTLFFLTQGIELSNEGGFLFLWKYGIAHGVTLVLLYVLIKARPGGIAPALLLGGLGVISLGLNFRSHALVCLIAAVLLLTGHFLGGRISRGWQFIGVAIFGLAFSVLMPIAARAGLFGSVLQRKTIEQEATNLPMLLAGRTEPPMTYTVITERPLLGWGSAFNITPDVYAQAEHNAVSIGFSPTFPFELYWRLPVFDYSAMHSILFGSWAEGGIVAFLLPAWLLVACGAIVWNHGRFGIWAPLALVVSLQGIWDLLYAPWTYNMVPEYACIALLFGAVHFRGKMSPE